MSRRHLPGIFLLLASLAASAAAGPASGYYVVHFSTGPAWKQGLPPVEQTGFREHSTNLGRMREAGTIVFGARYDEYGMLVVRAPSPEAANALFADDPGVRSEIFVYRVAALNVFYPWQEAAPAD